jgi:hypothetical protein
MLVSQCLRSVTMTRSRADSGIAGTGALRNLFAVAAEVLSEEPHHYERVESEGHHSADPQFPHAIKKGRGFCAGGFRQAGSEIRVHSLEAGGSDQRLAARLNDQPNFVDGAWANECDAEPWRRKRHQRTGPKTTGPRLRLGPARRRSQPGCERRQPAFSQTSPRELARKWSREAASPASKLEKAKITGDLLQPLTDRFKSEVLPPS